MNQHTGARPYKCKSCDFAASDSSSLYKHRILHGEVSKKQATPTVLAKDAGTAETNSASMIVKLLTGQLTGNQQGVKQEVGNDNIFVQSGGQLIQLSDFGASHTIDLSTNNNVVQMPGHLTSHMIQVPGEAAQQATNQTAEEDRLQNQMAIDSIMALANVVPLQNNQTQLQHLSEQSTAIQGHSFEGQEEQTYETIEIPLQNNSQEIHEECAEEEDAQEASRLSFREAVDEIVATVMVDEPEMQQLPVGSITEIQVPLMTSDGTQGEYLLILQPNETDEWYLLRNRTVCI